MTDLGVGTILVRSAQSVRATWPQILVCALVCFVPIELVRLFEPSGGAGAVSFPAAVLFGILHDCAITRVTIEHARGRTPTTRDALARAARLVVRCFAMEIVRALLILGGMLLLLVPGIIASMRYSLAVPALVERDVASTKALQASARLTDGYKWRLFLVFTGSALVAMVPVVSLGLVVEVLGTSVPSALAVALGLVVDWIANVTLGVALSVPAAVAYAELSPAETRLGSTDALVETFA